MTDQDKQDIAKIVAELVPAEMDKARLARRLARPLEETEEKVERILLVTPDRRMAFPDQNGRAIFTDAFFARAMVTKRNGQPVLNLFDAQVFELVAWGDGQILEPPRKLAIAGGYGAMVDVTDIFADRLAKKKSK